MSGLVQNLEPGTYNTQRRTAGLLQKCPWGKNGVPGDGSWDCTKMPDWGIWTPPAFPSALPFIAYQHCPSKQGQEKELSIGNL